MRQPQRIRMRTYHFSVSNTRAAARYLPQFVKGCGDGPHLKSRNDKGLYEQENTGNSGSIVFLASGLQGGIRAGTSTDRGAKAACFGAQDQGDRNAGSHRDRASKAYGRKSLDFSPAIGLVLRRMSNGEHEE